LGADQLPKWPQGRTPWNEKKDEKRDAWTPRLCGMKKATLDALDANLEALIETTDLLAHAALVAAGYHQHKRGEWRKLRGHSDEAP
jgi:hypothetical protein